MYFILNQYNLYLCNNTLTNVIYNKGSISSYTNVTVMDNGNNVVYSANVTDNFTISGLAAGDYNITFTYSEYTHSMVKNNGYKIRF